MKPLGPIPPGFEAIDGELAIGDTPVSDLVGRAGRTPLFVYSRERVARRFAAPHVTATSPHSHESSWQ